MNTVKAIIVGDNNAIRKYGKLAIVGTLALVLGTFLFTSVDVSVGVNYVQ